ncbi:MAG TPA: DUF2802 domain-containing protein [Azospira sp.]|nr:DUF2802 domain-containing protein [Azospira sp.]
MNFDDLAFGWREALLGVVALLVLYVAIVFLRLRRLRRQPVEVPVPPATPPVLSSEQIEAAYAEQTFPWNEPPDAPADAVRLAALESEVHSLRAEVVTLRGQLAATSGELSALRGELRRELDRVDEHVQASQHVAPIYGDAMQMALAGHDAASIAERCGVARAEAELVVALIRNRDENGGGLGSNESTMKER